MENATGLTQLARAPKRNAAEAFLTALKRHGVDHLFGNAGTDFASIIEAYASHRASGDLPQPITVPHENLAVAMAHGAYLATGRAQAVMVHVSVGTANAVCGLINAARENVPILLCAGRTPITESGAHGSRNAFIHWGQEMFDQAAMVREFVKWDYELRRSDQAEKALGRAYAIAMSEPRGPVYLTLPREILAEHCAVDAGIPAADVSTPMPDAGAVNRAAEWLARAERPVLITAGLGRRSEEVEALSRFAGAQAVPVVAYRARYMALPTGDPAFAGYEPSALVSKADLVLVAACDVPWIPASCNPPDAAKVVHLGHDPLFARYPFRSFRADLNIVGDPGQTLALLKEARTHRDLLQRRRERLEREKHAFNSRRATIPAPSGTSSPAWVAQCLAACQRPGDTIVSETAFPTHLLSFEEPGSFYSAPSAGGLGWALGAALGVKLSAPERRVICLVGDGSYMFGNPTPAHYVAAAMKLPTLTVILNNRMWGAVRRATLAVYPNGAAAQTNDSAFTYLEPSPDYEMIVRASGGHGEKATTAAELPAALDRALHAVGQGLPAVVNVLVGYSDNDARNDIGG
jgi:acetolactate synthase-1/2/3 large subunit